MKITRIRLENIRSYRNETVELPEGTVLIRGENGAGKSTLLMSIFGGLFLSRIRHVGSNSFTLDDLVRRGTDTGRIELTFEVEGVPYTTTWTIRTDGQNSATLESPALDEPRSGIKSVRRKVVDILEMDEKSFSRSVYVQQGEVDRLFDDEARANLIDDQLGLDEIDQYITRMNGARRAAKRLVRDNEQEVENYRETIDEEFAHDVAGYESTIADKEKRISDIKSDLEEVREALEQLEEGRRELEERLETYDELQADLADAEQKREELREERAEKQLTIEECEEAIEEASAEIDEHRDRIADLETELQGLDTPQTIDPIEVDLSDADTAAETLEAARGAVEDARVAETDRRAELRAAEDALDRLIEKRDDLRQERDELSEALSDTESERADVEADLTAVEEELSAAVERRDTATLAFLPEDSRPDKVTDETLGAVEAYHSELAERRNEKSNELAAKRAELEGRREDAEEAREAVESAKAEVERLSERRDELETKLESARDELEGARERFDTRLDELAGQLADFDLEVSAETLPTVVDERIPERLSELQEAIESANNQVTKLETELGALEDERDEFESLDGVGTCPTCGQTVNTEHLTNELARVESELETTETDLADARAERDRRRNRREQLESLRTEAVELRKFQSEMLTDLEERVADLKEDREDVAEDLADARDAVEDAEADRDAAEAEVERLESERDELETTVESLESQISEGENVLDAFDGVRQLRDERETYEDQLSRLREEQDELRADIEEKDDALAAVSDDIDSQRNAVEAAKDELSAAEQAVDTAETQRELAAEAVDHYDAIANLETTIESQQREIGHAQETIDNLNAQLTEVEADIDTLESELGEIDVEEIRAKLEAVEEQIEKGEARRDEIEADLQEAQEDRKVLENKLEQLQRFQDRLDRAERKREWAKNLVDEIKQTIGVYRSAKSELRKQYLAYINEYTNDIFDDVYKNSNYQQVNILEEGPDGTPYAIQLLRNDNTVEHPGNASGGERAIVNLALRAGIYKLIAEMRGGASGRLPPLILDEPTTFLDEGHVGRLESMLDSIASWDVPQVLVVSHDERLIQGAEHECVVSIDEESNASTVDVRTRGRTPGDD